MLQFKHFGSRGNKLPPSSFKSTPAILGVCIINNDQNFIAWALMNALDLSVFQFGNVYGYPVNVNYNFLLVFLPYLIYCKIATLSNCPLRIVNDSRHKLDLRMSIRPCSAVTSCPRALMNSADRLPIESTTFTV